MHRQKQHGWTAATLCLSLVFFQSARTFTDDNGITPEASGNLNLFQNLGIQMAVVKNPNALELPLLIQIVEHVLI